MGSTAPDSQSSDTSNLQSIDAPPSASSPPSSPSGGGLTLLIILFASFVVLFVITIFFIIYPSSILITSIVNFAAVGGFIIALIAVTVALANQNVGHLFAKSDAFLARRWEQLPRFGALIPTRTNIAFSLVIITLLSFLIGGIFYPDAPYTIHKVIFPNPGLFVDPKTGAGISQGDYHFSPEKFLDNSPNPETLIYNENRNIASDPYHVTMVVVTQLVQIGKHFVGGYDTLQAAYVFQHEANQKNTCKFNSPAGCMRIRLLVANAGDNLEYAPTIASQIIQIASKDPTLIGCFGFTISTPGGIEGVKILTAAKIPVISSTASTDALSAISPYFFRVTPIDSEQGLAAAEYIKNTFPSVHHALVLSASGNPYSITLATGFMSAFGRLSENRVLSKTYDTNATDDERNHQIVDGLTSAFQGTDAPDLVYFAGYSGDLNKVLNVLRKDRKFQKYSRIPIFSGDSAYSPTTYIPASSYQNIFFTTFASPDEWGNFSDPCKIDSSLPPSDLFCDYKEAFDPSNEYPGQYERSRTGYTAMLGYDAVTVLVRGYLAAYHSNQPPIKEDIQHAIQSFDVCHPLQGVSGLIAFAPDNNPVNKAIVLLKVDESGHTIFLSLVQGQLQASQLQVC